MSDDDFIDFTANLLPFGFTPGKAVTKNDPDLTVEDFRESLFGSTATAPKAVLVRVNDNDDKIPVVVDLMRAVKVVNEKIRTPAGQTVYLEHPDWYVEGDVLMTDTRVRIHVISLDGASIENMSLQFITDERAEDGIILVECID